MNTNKKIENCNEKLLEEQKEELINEIINGHNESCFWISDIEAGCRKTRTAEFALAKLCKTTDKKAILVRLNNKDCRESAENINELAGEKIAFAYNNEDVSIKERNSIQKTFKNIKVLVITHPKYRVLASDKIQRNIFCADRSVLVIDEFISEIEKIQLSLTDIKTYEMIFKSDRILWGEYLKIMKPFIDWFEFLGKKGRCFSSFIEKKPITEINNFNKLVKANITSEMLQEIISKILLVEDLFHINISILTELKTVKQLCNKIDSLKEFFTHISVYENDTFYTTNTNVKNWLLTNNIILDASGELQVAYEFNNELYKMQHSKKVLDHSKWKLINIKVNTTNATKEKMTKFYEVVNNKIAKYGNDIIVIGNQSELDEINLPEGNKAYFGNITGSNEYADKKHVAIIKTHNLNDIDYILTYLHYSKEFLNKELNISSRSIGRKSAHRYEFANADLEKVRCMWIASETYQAIKRVNRTMSMSTDALIFMNNDDVINLLKKQLINCNIETLELSDNEVGYIKDGRDRYIKERKENSYASKFISLLADIQNGKHLELKSTDKTCKKKIIREFLGIQNASNFNHKVLSNTEVISYCKIRNISLDGQSIKFIS